MLAKKTLDNKFYENWAKKYKQACSEIQNREERMDELSEEIEKNLELVGATAVEDKLQDDVPNTIYSLRQAEIQIWVLTGDKIETAINIAFSCKLLTDQMLKIVFDEKEEKSFCNKMESTLLMVILHLKLY